jgi:hypothetical protein
LPLVLLLGLLVLLLLLLLVVVVLIVLVAVDFESVREGWWRGWWAEVVEFPALFVVQERKYGHGTRQEQWQQQWKCRQWVLVGQ